MNLKELDDNTPGGVYLCQVNVHISCAACCGLYNVADPSREALTEMLKVRSLAFASVPRTPEGILGFQAEMESKECQDRPYPGFHHCPFIGLIGEKLSRAGCLLHPLADGNEGMDFRGLSYYGGMACRSYFCPACKELPEACKQIVRAVAQDWYSFGLAATERQLLKAFFREVEKRLGRNVKAEDFTQSPERISIFREFLDYRIKWPFRFSGSTNLCNYFFADQIYQRSPVNYAPAGVSSSPYDSIFRELDSHFSSPEALHRAEEMLDDLFARIIP
ncbi:MAG: hypothetical protein R2941_20000 [Desulfobacterales bacterium]